MIRIMIIDDEAPARIAIMKLGHWADYGITEFYEESSGEAALKTMRNVNPQIIFVDMQMPGLSGIDFLNIAAKDYPNAKFIVCSGYDYFSYAKAALQCGVLDYLLKPIARDELNSAIDKAVHALGDIAAQPADPSDTKLTPDEVVRLIHRDIDEHYGDPLKVSRYAEQYFFTKEYLSRLFHQRYGQSIQEYVLQVRMTHARQLLLDPSLKIQEVAERVGYHDNNYFSKAFRAYYGASPKDLRRK